MLYLTNDDLKPFIKDVRLNQMIENDNNILTHAESIAIAEVKDALYSRYDIDTIFNNPNDYPQVKRWITTILLYYIHRRLPDQIVPPSVIRDYNEVKEIIKEVSDAKKSINLPALVIEGSESDATNKFRWGSNPPRTH
jgi:hypothetical protein